MILLIGATGQTGSETSRLLAERGMRARALVRDPRKAGGSPHEVVAGDASRPEDLDKAMRHIDTVFVSTSAAADLPSLQQTIFEAAKRAGVRRIVKVSALGSHPRAKFRFAAVHGESDANLQASGLTWTVLRPAYFLQNLLPSAPGIIAAGELSVPLGDGRLSPIDARDVAAAAVEVLTTTGRDNRAYDLTGPEIVGGPDLAAVFSRVLGRDIRYVAASPEEFTAMLLGFGVDEWTVRGIGEMYAVLSTNAAARVTPGFRELTGREATSVEQFIEDHASAFRVASATV